MEIDTRAENLLKRHNLRITDCRKNILSMFLNEPVALSHAYLEEHVSDKFDRVTIYRTLKSFLLNGVVHKVLDDAGGLKYALCHEACEDEHHHDHVHFKCDVCGRTICLSDIEIPEIKLPSGYMGEEKNLLVTGKCELC